MKQRDDSTGSYDVLCLVKCFFDYCLNIDGMNSVCFNKDELVFGVQQKGDASSVEGRGRLAKHGRKSGGANSVKHEKQKENGSLLLNKGRLICEVGSNDAIEDCGQAKDGCRIHTFSDICDCFRLFDWMKFIGCVLDELMAGKQQVCNATNSGRN
jgi:hypothetical protein